MDFTLNVWRQSSPEDTGRLVEYKVSGISPDSSFLEMVDYLNQQLIEKGEEPVSYASDCLEGICGTCSLTINGRPHGPGTGVTTCQLHMRSFKDGQSITIEPFRAKAFPIIKDLVVDRSAFDRVIQAGGYISVNTGSAPDANSIPVEKDAADQAMDAATCIGCGACVAACTRGSAMLFASAKITHLGLLPQGKVEQRRRVRNMVEQMDKEGFGNCTNQYACAAVCPKEIKAENIARLNREYLAASLLGD